MAASSSLSATLAFLPLRHSSSVSPNPKLALELPLHTPGPRSLPSIRSRAPSSSFRVFAAPEVVESQGNLGCFRRFPLNLRFGVAGDEVPEPSVIISDADKLAPKQKIRIKLRSYWVPLIEDSCKQIMDAARTTNAKTMGPVPLPTKRRVYCVLKSPHVHKDARFHFEIRTHQRLIDILHPTAQTIDSLMQLDLPAGVDVEVKL
ncbi:30S ribosomal protein S10, chloroplastic [Dioscorea cayenensis subsp. rotundata]|uniref:Small ribosomal subunit protein uS10c n=1 Tax=Dioscorea cayennensis subsp. rotundata TaxID=55577 RepID=A0AB40AX76_DIOCR|nr:30S ribosomal protein S10, chloroplastic [Dioscorea cayenensis subsp. rotundata]